MKNAENRRVTPHPQTVILCLDNWLYPISGHWGISCYFRSYMEVSKKSNFPVNELCVLQESVASGKFVGISE